MDLQAYAQDIFFNVGGADLEYSKQNTLTNSWYMVLYWSIYFKITEIRYKIKKLKNKFS